MSVSTVSSASSSAYNKVGGSDEVSQLKAQEQNLQNQLEQVKESKESEKTKEQKEKQLQSRIQQIEKEIEQAESGKTDSQTTKEVPNISGQSLKGAEDSTSEAAQEVIKSAAADTGIGMNIDVKA